MFTSILKVARAVWGVILFAFPAFILYPRHPFLASSDQDTGLDGPVVGLSMAWLVFWWGVYFQQKECIYMSSLALQGDQRTKK